MSYLKIANHYESCLKKHGASAKGMDWPNAKDLATRFDVMLGVAEKDERKKISLLDLGCGVGLMLDHLKKKKQLGRFSYKGIDISDDMIEAAEKRWPSASFEARDILRKPLSAKSFDYIIMNGVMTEKVSLSQKEMVKFAHSIISSAFASCKKGIAFNVMSEHVDWKRDDLFHWPFDECAAYLKKSCSRHIVIRADYGLYEYTVYVFREPRN